MPQSALLTSQDGKPTNLILRHILRDAVDRFVLEAIKNAIRHRLAHGRVRPAAIGNRPDDDIAIRDVTDEAIAIRDWQRPDVLVAHLARRVADRILRVNAA